MKKDLVLVSFHSNGGSMSECADPIWQAIVSREVADKLEDMYDQEAELFLMTGDIPETLDEPTAIAQFTKVLSEYDALLLPEGATAVQVSRYSYLHKMVQEDFTLIVASEEEAETVEEHLLARYPNLGLEIELGEIESGSRIYTVEEALKRADEAIAYMDDLNNYRYYWYHPLPTLTIGQTVYSERNGAPIKVASLDKNGVQFIDDKGHIHHIAAIRIQKPSEDDEWIKNITL